MSQAKSKNLTLSYLAPFEIQGKDLTAKTNTNVSSPFIILAHKIRVKVMPARPKQILQINLMTWRR